RVCLHGPVGDQHLVLGHPVPFGDPGAQRLVPHGRAVGEAAGGVVGEGAVGGGLEPLDIDDVQRGGATGEGDRSGFFSHAFQRSGRRRSPGTRVDGGGVSSRWGSPPGGPAAACAPGPRRTTGSPVRSPPPRAWTAPRSTAPAPGRSLGRRRIPARSTGRSRSASRPGCTP